MWPDAEGQQAARRAVRAAQAAGRMPSALLVEGEPGLGKRAFAEWVAALRWCEEPEAPCGECRSCRQVRTGNHPDLLVLARDPDDPEGLGSRHEITVDQVRRRLIPALGVRPVQTDGHAVVIDGADALNESAQNALLKTLEEPPAGSLILLLCAHPEALLETVRSRCQVLRLQPLDEAALRARFPDAGPELLALASGRPGRVDALARLDVAGLAIALDDVLCGRASGSAFARAVQAAVDAASPDAASDGGSAETHRLAAEVLLGHVARRAASRAAEAPRNAEAVPVAGEPPWHAVEAALFEVGADLHRHLPPAVAWGAAGQALASMARTDLGG